MVKNQRQQKKNCLLHNFSLKPEKQNCHYYNNIQISFCFDKISKSHHKKQLKIKKDKKCLLAPTFNHDKNYASPTFILSTEQKYYEEKKQNLKNQHQDKLIQYNQEKSQICIAKPRTKQNYCSVCKLNYEDYIDHIEDSKHKKKIHHNKFNDYILQIEQNFNSHKNLTRIKNHHNYHHSLLNLSTTNYSHQDDYNFQKKIFEYPHPKHQQQHMQPNNFSRHLIEKHNKYPLSYLTLQDYHNLMYWKNMGFIMPPYISSVIPNRSDSLMANTPSMIPSIFPMPNISSIVPYPSYSYCPMMFGPPPNPTSILPHQTNYILIDGKNNS